MTALEDARAALAEYEALGIGTSDAAGVLRALIAEYELLTARCEHGERICECAFTARAHFGEPWNAAPITDDEREALAQIKRETPADEASIQADTESLAAEIHEAWEFQYDQCDHGLYMGGHLHGEPYAMCRLSAERIVRRRLAKAQEGGGSR